MDITVADEMGHEETEDILDHLRKWHGYNSDHEYPDGYYAVVHSYDHDDAGIFDFHAHPLNS